MLEVHVDATCDERSLCAAVATALGLAPAQLRCEVLSRQGEFGRTVTVYNTDAAATEIGLASILSRALGGRCLVSDDTVNPFHWVLITATDERVVYVDADALEHDALVLLPSEKERS